MKKLSNYGFSHVLVPVLAFLMVAGLGGAYFLSTSHAAPAPTSTTSTSTSTAEPVPTGSDATDDATLAANVKTLLALQASSQTHHVCLYYDQHKCLVTHGVGNQLTIQGTGTTPSNIQVGAISSTTVVMQDGSGNCLRANSDQTVTVESGQCSSNQDGEVWIVTKTFPFHFKSYKFRNNNWFLGTKSNGAGEKVWALLYGTPNSWISWQTNL